MPIFEQRIQIRANVQQVEACVTDLTLMHQWLNPLLRCDPVGDWTALVDSRCRFVIQLPGLAPSVAPSLNCVVVERSPQHIVWQFTGFFTGCDRWEWHPMPSGDDMNGTNGETTLVNQFSCEIPNPVVKLGFDLFAKALTARDMQAQLVRLKGIAEGLAES